ncbi:hypothetical protein WICMUC_002423 [Wickerhamomyces mucosus]|uniref:RRM domain-containing protein n=1 Tax=Wickerhamomyces mucosus TaxID=1378264 RepID=A0A9P8TEP9_9ASCO|nr:hypothetical protein WICMUC_002423 [Wickerhamomyces mucosus]
MAIKGNKKNIKPKNPTSRKHGDKKLVKSNKVELINKDDEEEDQVKHIPIVQDTKEEETIELNLIESEDEDEDEDQDQDQDQDQDDEEEFEGFSDDEEISNSKDLNTKDLDTKDLDLKSHEFKPLITSKQQQQHSKSNQDKKSLKKGLIYISRLPKGFEKNEILKYFNQFGNIININIPINKKTGNFKHYAFLQFDDLNDAKIAVETMNNYLILGHILKCKLIENEEFKSKGFKRKNSTSLNSYKLNKSIAKLNENVSNKRNKRKLALKSKGIDF